MSFVLITWGCSKSDDNNTPNTATVTDIDGNIYHTVTIGTQTWMVENLKVTKFRNGVAIPNITDGQQWRSATTSAYCNYNNNLANVATYGRLYNWYAVNDSNKICPPGWHIPTYQEWATLMNFLGGENVAGDKLKEKGPAHWGISNTSATNENGFTALPAGTRSFEYATTDFSNQGGETFWWTSSVHNATIAWHSSINCLMPVISINCQLNKKNGFSLRCIKD